jgi:hypothetical protein
VTGLQPLHPVVRHHLHELSGPFGIWQHARGTMADPAFGSCTDDVARSLQVDQAHARTVGVETVADNADQAVAFLEDAFDPTRRRFRNFRGADGGWARSEPSEDSQGRAIAALGTTMAWTEAPRLAERARLLLEASLTGMHRLRAIRAVASCTLGYVAALEVLPERDPLRHDVEAVLRQAVGHLRFVFAPARGPRHDPDWPWPDRILTYETGLPASALVVGGQWLGDQLLVDQGLATIDWLIRVQTGQDGRFSPVGNAGWWPKGGERAQYDQQPIEAATMIAACQTALAVADDRRYRAAAEAAYGWFLGANDTGVPVATPSTGGCHDGLEPDSVNANQGAESTLAWLLALERVRMLRDSHHGLSAVPDPVGPGSLASVPAGRGR